MLDTGFEGDPCNSSEDCQHERGFYCKEGGTCARRKPAGALCGVHTSSDECDGVCIASGAPGTSGVCVPAQLEGGVCRADWHCKQVLGRLPTTEQLVCNTLDGNVGKCVPQTRLIRLLGVKCNPSFDRCDARRGLACLWAASSKQYVCQQRVTTPHSSVFCTPGSPLSVCRPLTGHPHTCRQEPGRGRPQPLLPIMVFFACFRTDIIPLGRACSTSLYGVCEGNNACVFVSGVKYPKSSFDFLPPTRFCVQTVGIGASCTDKFTTRCDTNLACVNGRCIPTSSPAPPSPLGYTEYTHADINMDCSELPCVPGTVCVKPVESFGPSAVPVCKVPSRVMKAGEPCFETALISRICAPGLICSQNNKGSGLLRCRKPAPVGAFCKTDDACEANLKCSPTSRTSPLIGRCYDPALTLPIGASCNLNTGLKAKRCVLASIPNPTGNFVVELRCLPKATGFFCQRVALLYELCNSQFNIACVDGAVCSTYGVCLPPS